MSEFFDKLDPQAEKDRQRHQDEVALRINALPLPWDVKVEIWQEELALSETTFCLVLKRHGVDVPEGVMSKIVGIPPHGA